jgi:oxygen-independent coproporphyrinogen III oxidase
LNHEGHEEFEFMNLAHIKHLYIHIPFCQRRCSYCDFNTYANMEHRMAAYVDALCKEMATYGQGQWTSRPGDKELDTPVSCLPVPLSPCLVRSDLRPTVFLGGGTPSALPLELIERVLAAANELIPLAAAEVTVEANPGTLLGRDYLRALRGLGVNRLSMGVQSLHDPTLRLLGRIHSAAEAHASYEDARRAGFDNLNLDFIFGLPGQTLEQWDATLREIGTWGADHFSLYSLILEERTPLYAQVLGGRVSVPDDDATAEMYELAIERLGAAGYVQYEISNWARDDRLQVTGYRLQGLAADVETPIPCPLSPIPSAACHHNLAYWLNADYLACGAGAHGHIFPRRYFDVLGIDDYIGRVAAGASPIAETTALTEQDLYAETMFMGLRLNAGVGYAHFRDRCGTELDQVYGETLAELEHIGLLERDEAGVRLTARGRMLGNQVFERFV